MNSQAKKFLRIIIQQVHPDKFGKHPVEQRKNSESLKAGHHVLCQHSMPCAVLLSFVSLQVLNAYIDRLARGRSLSQQRLEFCTVDGEHISTVEAVLPASGNLGSLFYAFGLVSKAESAHQSATSGLLLYQCSQIAASVPVSHTLPHEHQLVPEPDLFNGTVCALAEASHSHWCMLFMLCHVKKDVQEAVCCCLQDRSMCASLIG